MKQADIDGVTLEYDVRGSGEAVVFIHGAHMGDTFAPLMEEPSLSEFRLIRYRRRGFAGSSRAEGPLSIAEQAADCLALLRKLDAEPAHVVGHSGGGVIALQFALDTPDAVRSLSLLEPALLAVPSGPQLAEQLARTAVQLYEAGDKAAAVDAFLEAVCGTRYRAVCDKMLPGALTQAVADADTFFGVDFPALGEWVFHREDAARIRQPALVVLGAESDAVWPGYGEGHRLLLDWLPRARQLVLPRAAHLLQVENPSDMARALAVFLADI
jgi:pimeloyl-ACP methyl ester carboxylesterase